MSNLFISKKYSAFINHTESLLENYHDNNNNTSNKAILYSNIAIAEYGSYIKYKILFGLFLYSYIDDNYRLINI